MTCPTCGFDVPPELPFCGMCGTRVAQLCPECGAVNPLVYRFCGIGTAMIFVIFAMLNMVTTLSSYPFGSFSDNYSRRKIIRAAWILYALVYAGFAFATEEWHAWGIFIAYGIFYGMTEGVQKALVADLVPEQHRGTAYGLFNATVGLALLPASIIAGLLWEAFDHRIAFLFGASLAVVGSVMLSFVKFPHAK